MTAEAHYDDVVRKVGDELRARIGAAVSAGAYVVFAGLIGGAAWRVEFMADWRTVLQG